MLDLFANGELINILDEKENHRYTEDSGTTSSISGTVGADQKNEWYQTSIKNRSLDFDAQVIDDRENELATISRRISKERNYD